MLNYVKLCQIMLNYVKVMLTCFRGGLGPPSPCPSLGPISACQVGVSSKCKSPLVCLQTNPSAPPHFPECADRLRQAFYRGKQAPTGFDRLRQAPTGSQTCFAFALLFALLFAFLVPTRVPKRVPKRVPNVYSTVQ